MRECQCLPQILLAGQQLIQPGRQGGGTRLEEIDRTWLSRRAQDYSFQTTSTTGGGLREQEDVRQVTALREVAEVTMQNERNEVVELEVEGGQMEIRAERKHRDAIEPVLWLAQRCGVPLEKPHAPNAGAGVFQLSLPDLFERLAAALHLEGDPRTPVRCQDIRAPTCAVRGQSGNFDRRLPPCIADGLSDEQFGLQVEFRFRSNRTLVSPCMGEER